MLTHLSINNFAIVDKLDLEFSAGMTAITGETGAGKSILLDALGLTLGDRADAHCVHHDCQRADITASFDIRKIKKAMSWLKENDFISQLKDDDNAHEVLLRRTITKEGRSRGFINGQPAPLVQLKTLGEMLIDIHSQHEHQSLLIKDTHKIMLDEFGDATPIANKTQTIYGEWQKVEKEILSLKSNSAEKNALAQLLNYQVQELQALNLQPGEIKQLEEEQKQLSQAGNTLTNCLHILNLLDPPEESGVSSSMSLSIQLMQQIESKNATLNTTEQLLISSQIQLEEAKAELAHFTATFEENPQQLKEIEDRLSTIYQIARKHRIPGEKLLETQQELESELNAINNCDEQIDSLEKTSQDLMKQYFEQAETLSNKRQIAAQKLKRKIDKQLKLLGMASSKFEVALASCNPSYHGIESIEFLISTNPGQPALPLHRIASGGELSRISLAIQVATAQTSRTPTLVFDEVDVGIGGATAEVVGNLLRQLGDNGQVLCVTHQAQVASKSHEHLFVSKKCTKNYASTTLVPLKKKDKVKEIARMMGGISLTEQSLAHAEQMLSPCH